MVIQRRPKCSMKKSPRKGITVSLECGIPWEILFFIHVPTSQDHSCFWRMEHSETHHHLRQLEAKKESREENPALVPWPVTKVALYAANLTESSPVSIP